MLERRVAEWEAAVQDRTARLSTNAPKPVTKNPAGKKPGGQSVTPGSSSLRRVSHEV